MNRLIPVLILCAICPVALGAQQVNQLEVGTVTHVHTALDHLTVLEFGQPVTMAAAGSAAFLIERHENKVFVRPLKAGASTNLFVWTASGRFSYELEPAGEVTNMNSAIDSPAPKPQTTPDTSGQLEHVADMVLTRAFLGAEKITSDRIKAEKNHVTVRVEEVFRTASSTYIHYSILNRSKLPFRVSAPAVYELHAGAPSVALPSLEHTQLDRRMLGKLGGVTQTLLPLAHTESMSQDVASEGETRGVLVVRRGLCSPTVVQLVFDGDVKATIVL
jgi:hypothetical protein